MPKITILPNPEYCPAGTTFDAAPSISLCDAMQEHGVEIDHACGKVGACTTCHVLVTQGLASLNEVEDQEEDMLDRAWGLQANSRLSCQARLGDTDVTIDIPRYSVNLAKENPP